MAHVFGASTQLNTDLDYELLKLLNKLFIIGQDINIKKHSYKKVKDGFHQHCNIHRAPYCQTLIVTNSEVHQARPVIPKHCAIQQCAMTDHQCTIENYPISLNYSEIIYTLPISSTSVLGSSVTETEYMDTKRTLYFTTYTFCDIFVYFCTTGPF